MQKLLTIKMASALLNRSYNTTALWISEREEETGSGLAIQHFPARGGELVHHGRCRKTSGTSEMGATR
jgi:hypothetical protein